MNDVEMAQELIAHPEAIGWALGYTDLRPALHGKWIRQLVTTTKDCTLQAHRGSYKTTCLGIVIALRMIRDGGKNIIFVRKTDSDVAEVIKNVQRILESDIIKSIYKALTGNDLEIIRATASEITTSTYTAPRGSSQLMGIGIGGSITGKHADVIITDDIVNKEDRASKAERDRTKAVYQELQNIKNRDGVIINTGTPWHKEDAFSLMPEPMKYDCYSTGLMTKEQIDEIRLKMTPSLFAANYELQHIAVENALFIEPPQYFNDIELIRDGICHVDAAYGGNDYTAFTCGKRVGDTLYMYGKLWHNHVDTVMDFIVAEAQRLMCAPLHCEDNGDKGFLANEFRKHGLRAVTYHEAENKNTKISTFLRKWWTKIQWLEGTDSAFINQIMDYTEDAEHDDAPDSAACQCRYWDARNRQGYISAFNGGG